MKNIRFYTLLALLMLGGVTTQAQELNEILYSPDSWVYSMVFEDAHTFPVFLNETPESVLCNFRQQLLFV